MKHFILQTEYHNSHKTAYVVGCHGKYIGNTEGMVAAEVQKIYLNDNLTLELLYSSFSDDQVLIYSKHRNRTYLAGRDWFLSLYNPYIINYNKIWNSLNATQKKTQS